MSAFRWGPEGGEYAHTQTHTHIYVYVQRPSMNEKRHWAHESTFRVSVIDQAGYVGGYLRGAIGGALSRVLGGIL